MGSLSSGYRDGDGPAPPARELGAGRELAELAGRQHGVISMAQLRRLGLDRHRVARRVAAGQMHRLHVGVYAVGHVSLSRHGRYLAAVLACGPEAALSHRAAAHLHGLRPNPAPSEVTVPRGRAGPQGLTVHRSRRLARGDVMSVEGIAVTSVARTLLDLAGVVRPRELDRAVDRAERLRVFDLAAVEDALDRASGRRGAAALRAVIAAWQPRHTRSELEDRCRELLRSSDLPEPRFNAHLDGECGTHEVDVCWPAHGLAIQLDGFDYHRTRLDRERDAASDADLELAGYQVRRLTWDDVTLRAPLTLRRFALLLRC